MSKFIREEGGDTGPVSISTPELDPFQEMVIVWCINNVCEGMVIILVMSGRKFHIEGFLRYKKNECAETQYLVYPCQHAFARNIFKYSRIIFFPLKKAFSLMFLWLFN